MRQLALVSGDRRTTRRDARPPRPSVTVPSPSASNDQDPLPQLRLSGLFVAAAKHSPSTTRRDSSRARMPMQRVVPRPQSPARPAPTRASLRVSSIVVAALVVGLVVGFEIGTKSPANATAAAPPAPTASRPVPQPPAAVSTGAPAPTPEKSATATITLAVHSVKGDFGDYVVDLHDGNVAKQTTFNVNNKGEWSKAITVPVDAMVKLDIARTGATCEITDASGATLVRDENSCIIGS